MSTASLVQLVVTGRHTNRSFEVRIGGREVLIPRSGMEYLIELITALHTEPRKYLYNQKCRSTDGDQWRTNQVVHRLRGVLGGIIETGGKAYCLQLQREEVAVDDSVFAWPATHIDPAILAALRKALGR